MSSLAFSGGLEEYIMASKARKLWLKPSKSFKIEGDTLNPKVPVLMRNEPNLTVRTGQSAEIDFLIELEEHL